jgi:tripartite-type tricarboxylate transporter receptor subunit TctC
MTDLKLSRRRLLHAIGSFSMFGAVPAPKAWAQAAYPSKPITVIVSAAAGGVVDLVARAITPTMSAQLGQPLVVDNRPGGGGQIGVAAMLRAPADGYTLLVSAGAVLLSGVQRNLSYDPFAHIAPVGMIGTGSFILVVPASSPFTTLQDLIAHAKANPGKVTFGSTSVGNSTHIGAEMLAHLTGTRMLHVPYKGSSAALVDLVSGRLDFMLDNKASSLQQIQSGRLRALGVTGRARTPELPNVPAIGEIVPSYQIEGWSGLFAPKAVPKPIIDRLSAALKAAIADPETSKRLAEGSGEPRYLDPIELHTFMVSDQKRLAAVVKAANISID